MKFLIIVETYIPHMCGITSVNRYIAEGLVAEGHEVIVVTPNCIETKVLQETIKGVNIYRFNIYRNILKKPCGEKRMFIDFVKSVNADIVVFECINSLTTEILWKHISEIKGLKILHNHGDDFISMKIFVKRYNLKYTLGNIYAYILRWYQRIFFYGKCIRQCDAAICLSKIASDLPLLQRYAKKIYILENAADNIFFDAFNVQDSNTFDLDIKFEKYIISIANYQKVKNQELIIRAYLEATTTENYSLVLIGGHKNDYYNYLQQIIATELPKNKNKDIVMLTGIERKNLPLILKGAKVFVAGSEIEQYSISLIEAMSLGIPFVSTNVGNARILPGGITVERESELSQTIDKILSDKHLYNNLSENGLRYANTHCKESIAVTNLLNIVKELQSNN